MTARNDGVAVSFEFFPPTTESMEKTLWDSVSTIVVLSCAPTGAASVSMAIRQTVIDVFAFIIYIRNPIPIPTPITSD